MHTQFTSGLPAWSWGQARAGAMSDSCLYGKRTEGHPVHCLSLSFPQPCPLDGKSREKVGAELLVAQEALCPSTSRVPVQQAP